MTHGDPPLVDNNYSPDTSGRLSVDGHYRGPGIAGIYRLETSLVNCKQYHI